MIARNQLALLCCCFFIGLLLCRGAELPPRPETHLQDDSGLFSEAQKQEITSHWQQLEQAGHGDFHLLTLPYLPAPFTALFNHLRNQWPKDDLGGVFVYSRGDSHWYFIASRRLIEEVNPHDITAANEALANLKMQSPDGIQQLTGVLRRVTDSLAEKIELRNRGNRVWQPSNLLLTGGLLMAGLTVFLLAHWRVKHRRTPQQTLDRQQYFPPVRVGYRLGGPFSGGTVAEAKFNEEQH